MACKEREIQSLQERVIELERQLAEAQAVIQALPPVHGDSLPSTTESEEQAESDRENVISVAGIRRAIYAVPYPLMIRRDDGQVVMINSAWTEITGYTLEDIPTIDDWTRKAYGQEAPQTKSLILNEGFSQDGIKQWGEFEVTTRSAEKRIWEFSTTSLGVDEQDRRLVMSMAVDITERKHTEEKLRAARDEAKLLARFPGENPNPVVRVSNEGVVLYCNLPAASLRGWRCAIDTALSRPLLDLVELAIEQRQVVEQDILLDDKFYSVSAIPILEQGYLNLYGKDITERKQAEKALAESERRQREIARLLELDQARLAAILQHLPVGVWIADQTGRLIGSNEQADRIWAGEAPLLNSTSEYGKYVAWYPESGKLLQPEEYPLALSLRTGQPVQPVELNIRRFDGSQGIVLFSAAPIKDSQGLLIGAVGVNVDITELQLAEERFNKAFHASPNALVISRLEDGRIETVNDMFVRFFGYSEEEVVGKTSIELGMFVNLADRQEAVRKLQRDKAVRDFELDVRLKSGEVRNASLSIEMINIGGNNMMLTTIQDITLRKRAEEALRESEARYRGLFEMMQEGLVAAEIITDEGGNPVDYRYLDVNPATERQFGIPREQFIGRTYTEVLPEGDREWIEIFGKVALTGESVSLERYGKANKRWFEAHIYSPRPGQAINILTDITERKQAEQALGESEARYRGLVESQFDLIVRVDPEGLFTFVNDAYCQKFGLKREEILDQENFKPLVHPEDLPQTLESMKSLYQPPYRAIMEQRAFTVEGVRWIEWQDSAILDESGKVVEIQAIGRDVTYRKQAEAALRESEQRLKRAQEIAHLGSWELNLVDNRLTWSDEVYRIFGLQPQEFGATYQAFLEAVHPEDRAAVDNAYSSSIREGRDMYEIEHRVVKHSNGEVRIVHEKCEHFRDQNGQIIRSMGMVHDITDRKKTEEVLRERETRYRTLFESIDEGFCIVEVLFDDFDHPIDYRFLTINPAFVKHTGLQDAAGKHMRELAPGHEEHWFETYGRIALTGQSERFVNQARQLDDRWYDVYAFRVGQPQDRKVAILFTDITERKKAEEQLKDYAQRLERSNQELEQFAFMASHDLQEPLRKIEMFGDMLLERGLKDKERNYVDRMRNASGRMRDMVEGLLQLSRVTTQGKPFVQVDLSQVTSEVLHDLEVQIRRTNGKVKVETLPTLEGDALQLRQLMQNLIGNALKYHQPGTPPEVNVTAKELSGKVQILIEDKGIGFAQEDAKRIFQPFQRLVGRSQYEGSGMGLAICRRIVERHGGEISARSQPGHGTTLIVTLPVHPTQKSRSEL